jgi:ATP-dependent DNA helicase RecG
MDREKLIRELMNQIRLGEDSRYEFKRVEIEGNTIKGPKQRDLADEIAAFANQKGGFIVLGVDDKSHEVTGIPQTMLDSVQAMVTRAAQDNIEPPLPIYVRLLELPNRVGELHPVIVIEIDKSLFVHASSGHYFYRVNESKKEMRSDFLARLMMQRSQARMIWFDEQQVPRTSKEDLDIGLANHFLRDSGEPAAMQWRKLKLVVDDENGKECLSVAGVLMATSDPRQWLESAYIQAVCYSGDRRHAEDQVDALDISGPLNQQVMQALHFVEKNMQVAAKKTIGRTDIPQYHLGAILEALVNAVAHRDYAIHGAKIRLHMFEDYLIIASPGALVNTLGVDELSVRQATRNQLLTSLLARCEVDHPAIDRRYLMDKRGEGVPLIIKESHRLSLQWPEYRLAGEELQLTIYAASKEKNGLVAQ